MQDECTVQLNEQQSACEEMSPNPAEPAGPTFPCTAPGIVKGAALSLGARDWLTAHGGGGRAVTALRASLSPRYLSNLKKKTKTNSESLLVIITQLYKDKAKQHRKT